MAVSRANMTRTVRRRKLAGSYRSRSKELNSIWFYFIVLKGENGILTMDYVARVYWPR